MTRSATDHRPAVLVLYTGGTIGMTPSENGFVPTPGYLGRRLRQIVELLSDEMPRWELHEYETLLDSANMRPADWTRIARDIERHYDDFDGFVVVHGTDTMAYTASALSFMLENLGKTVVLTGSQIPMWKARNDARDNLFGAMQFAVGHDVPEVCVYFDHHLWRGNRVRKIDASGLGAFESWNYPALGEAGVSLRIRRRLVRPPPTAPLALTPIPDARVGHMRLFPGIHAGIVRNHLLPPLQGLVLEAYGSGTCPAWDTELLDALAEATARGVVIVACTQCLRGSVELGDYTTSAALLRAGVTSGADMTPEAALAKLAWLFQRTGDPDEVRRQIGVDHRGELTVR